MVEGKQLPLIRRWVNSAALITIVGLSVFESAHTMPTPVVEAQNARVAKLEAEVSRNPMDSIAVLSLVEAYRSQKNPGLAVSVLERSSSSLFASAVFADGASAAYLEGGQATRALAAARQVIALCVQRSCEASLMARATRREQILAPSVEMGIEDPLANPQIWERAWQRSSRQIHIALNDLE